MLCKTYCATCLGLTVVAITVETDISSGIGIQLVGLPDSAVRESLTRVLTAIRSYGYRIPGKRIIINLAPADIKKQGSAFDLAIAVTLICAITETEPERLKDHMFLGELALDGSIRDVPGALPIAVYARDNGFKGCVFPYESAKEAVDIEGVDLYGVRNLADVLRIMKEEDYGDLKMDRSAKDLFAADKKPSGPDFCVVKGQEHARRGFEIAAAGGHNTFIMGAPGSRKAVLAKTISELLPDMDKLETIENDKIYSVSDREIHHGQRPFRMPHYSSSITAMVGGGAGNIRPGEVTLANNGVLYLDEYAEMPKSLKEALRGPIEDKKVVISRLKSKIEYPADFLLVVGSMPCPCGYYGNEKKCMCAPGQRSAYLNRLSGPVFDRIDIQMYNRGIDDNRPAASFETTRERVAAARVIQEKRLGKKRTNAEMTREEIEKYCKLNAEGYELLMKLIERLGLSMRAYTRILKVARTIADLDRYEDIRPEHLSEAAGYRFLDRNIYHELLNNK